MIIIVEGVDNSGKTTLAQFLAKQLRAVYLKVERPKKGSDLDKFNNLLQVARTYSGVVVADRHLAISEPIYGPICRGKHDLNTKEIQTAIQEVSHIIYCRPPRKKIIETVQDRPQMEGVNEHIEELIDAYDALFVSGFGPGMPKVIEYDYTRHLPTDVLTELTYHLTKTGSMSYQS